MGGIDIGSGFSLDLNAHTNGAGVCPNCISELANSEFEKFVRPFLNLYFYVGTVFEQACVVTALWQADSQGWGAWSGSPPVKKFGLQDALNRRDHGILFWTVMEWHGPLIEGLSTGDFAREFVNEARRHGLTTTRLKLSRFKKVDVYTILEPAIDAPPRPALFVSGDGLQVYNYDYLGRTSIRRSGESMKIPAYTAFTLRRLSLGANLEELEH